MPSIPAPASPEPPSKRPPAPTSTRPSPPRTRRSVAAPCAIRSGAPRCLRAAAARLRAAGDEIVAVAGAETGLPEARLRGELERTAGQLEAFAAVVDAGDYVDAIIDTRRPRRQADPAARRAPHARAHRPGGGVRRQQLPARLQHRGRRHRQRARGRLPGHRQGPPVASGHERGGRARARAPRRPRPACPGATFALLQSSGFEVGEALVDEPAIAAVGFTGSFAGGKALHDRAAARERPIPVFAEMGSVNPIVVTEAALAERGEAIAEGLAASVASFGGQLCTKPGVVFVPAGEAGDAFAADLGARLAAAEPQVLLNERLRDALTERVAELGGLAEPRSTAPRRPPSRASASAPRPTARRRPTSASTPSCSRSASGPSSCC